MKLHMSSPGLDPDDDDDDNSPTIPLERPSFLSQVQRISETRIRVEATRARVDARVAAMKRRAAR